MPVDRRITGRIVNAGQEPRGENSNLSVDRSGCGGRGVLQCAVESYVDAVMPAAPCFLSKTPKHNVLCGATGLVRPRPTDTPQQKIRRAVKRAGFFLIQPGLDQEAAARGARLRELRWKNRAWLATAETIAGWNGFEIRNAGSGRSPVRKRSG